MGLISYIKEHYYNSRLNKADRLLSEGNALEAEQIYNDILAELYRGVLLPQIISDYRGDDDIWEYVGKFNENTYEKIKHSRYAIS